MVTREFVPRAWFPLSPVHHICVHRVFVLCGTSPHTAGFRRVIVNQHTRRFAFACIVHCGRSHVLTHGCVSQSQHRSFKDVPDQALLVEVLAGRSHPYLRTCGCCFHEHETKSPNFVHVVLSLWYWLLQQGFNCLRIKVHMPHNPPVHD